MGKDPASQRDYPSLRYLEVLPFQENEQDLRLLLRDPLEIGDQMLVMAPQLAALLPLLDGSRSLAEIQRTFSEQVQQEVPLDAVARVVARLDEAFFLDSDRFRERRRQVIEEFAGAEKRPPWHAGKSYPDDPLLLRETLNQFYLAPEGAGLPSKTEDRRPLRGMVAPHIDLRSGGSTYTHAYRALAESDPPDLFVILGTGHMGLPEMFSLSPKEFSTPLGSTPVDLDFLSAFRERAGGDLFVEDLTHRHEHTIEFQVVFLQHLFGPGAIPILPVLTSFSYEDLEDAGRLRLFETFVNAFRHAERATGKRICLISSVDLAHIGPRYGDPFQPDQGMVDAVSEKDVQMLAPVARGDAKGFHEYVRQERDERRICGFSPIFTLLTLLDGVAGETLRHDFSFMDSSRSFVTYASLAFPAGAD